MYRILRGLGGRVLRCGCIVGVYETYTGETVAIIDAKGSGCPERSHRVDSSIDLDASEASSHLPSTMPTVMR